MDQSTLVDNQIEDGSRFVERFAADDHPVQAAFWVKTAEEGLWFPYVATEFVDKEGPAKAYREAYASLQKLGTCWVSMSEIKLVSPRNPIARDVLAIMSRYPGRAATRSGRKALGSMAVEQIYIYPPHFFTFTSVKPMSREDIGREIVHLMSRDPGILQPSRVTLNNGTAFNGIPISLQLDSQKAPVVQFTVENEATPRVVRLDEITSIG